MELGAIADIKRINRRDGFASMSGNDEFSSEFDDDQFSGDEFEDDTFSDNEFDDESELDVDDGGPKLANLIDKLNSIKSEIDDILAHFDVESDDFDAFDDYDEYSHDDFDIDADMGDDEFSFYDQFDSEDSEFDSEDDEFEDGDEFESDELESDDEDNDDDTLDGFGSNSHDEFSDLDFDDEDASDEDSDFQGNIRTVAGASLVYKRPTENGNYEELWIYNVGEDISSESKIRRAILAGTDIPPTSTESDDGTQQSSADTVGNVQFLHITGLPN